MSQESFYPEAHYLRRWPRYQPMVLCLAAVIAGVLLDHFADWDWRIYSVVGVGALVGWRVVRLKIGQTPIVPVEMGSCILLFGWMAVGALWHHGCWNWFAEDDIGVFARSDAIPCCVEGVAISEPRWLAARDAAGGLDYATGEQRTRVTLRVKRIRDGVHWKPASGNVDVVIHATAEHFRAGDHLRVFGRLVRIRPPSNPGQFDFRFFYRCQRKLATIHVYYAASVEVVASAGWWPVRSMSNLRRRLNRLTWRFVHEDEAAFASAILLGNREQMSAARRDLFLETGTVHLLAISGLHVGVLAGSFYLLFRLGWVSRRKVLWATIAFVFFYAWLVEFRPPVTRAAILIGLFCASRLYGQTRFSWNLLAIAGLVVLFLNPCALFGLGTQLSFLAVASLMFGKDWVFWPPPADPLQRVIASTRSAPVQWIFWTGRMLRTAFLVSALIWWVAMPLVAFRFHLVAPVALLVNALLIFPIAMGLYGGLAVLIFGWFLSPVAKVSGFVCERSLALVEWMISVAQSIPLSHFWTAGPRLGSLLVFYVGLFLMAVFPLTRVRLRWILVLTTLWIGLAWIVPDRMEDWGRSSKTAPLVMTFIDVGHGTSVLIQFPNGRNVLYDAGSFGSSNYALTNISSVLWYERIEYLDTVVVSHADIDHFNAVPELSERFGIGQLVVSPQLMKNDSEAVQTLKKRMREQGIPLRAIIGGDSILGMKVLSPPPGGTGGNDNADSLVLEVKHCGHRILLPGDLESEGMEQLLRTLPMDMSVVMAPHHGSHNSDPVGFVNWSTPEVLLISGGNHRIRDEVVSVFRESGSTVFRTDRDGAIRVEVDRDGLKVMTWSVNHWIKRAEH